MSKPFDAVLNELIDARLADWAAFLCERLGLPPSPAEAVDTDLATTLQADKVFRLGEPARALVHLELESGSRLGIPDELLRYNVLVGHLYGLPVHSVLVLLRPRARASDQTGTLARVGADGREYLTFRYAVIRLWEEPLDRLLGGSPGVLPLALLTDEAAADLPAAFARFDARLRREDVPDTVKRTLYSAGYVLMGLRYDEDQIQRMYGGVAMLLEDSTTYQAILRKGEVRALQQAILDLGRDRLGEPSEPAGGAIGAIQEVPRLRRMLKRVLTAASWDELLTEG